MQLEQTTPKKRLRKGRILLFVLLFCVVFVCVQYVLLYKYEPTDNWPLRFADYAAEPAGTVDVVFLGTSQAYWGVSPMILWHEMGITSVNMSGILHQHTMVYEQLKALLEMNTPPKYVVFNPSSLISTYTADDEKIRPVYEQFIYTLPTLPQKASAFGAMYREAQDKAATLGTIIPLLRYHSRWNELTAEDFVLPNHYEDLYQPFLKGQKPMLQGINITEFVEGEKIRTKPVELVPQSMEGWKKIFDLCRENGITPIALIMPRFDGTVRGAPLEALTAFLDENGVGYINYMSEEAIAEMEWDYRRQFKDREHLNFRGSLYCSVDLAWQLYDLFDVPDRSEDPACAHWHDAWDEFSTVYYEQIVEALGEEYLWY